jgi:integrase
MRRGEILGLTWDRVNTVQGVIRLRHTKNGEAQEIPINETVHAVLAGLRTRIDVLWVFHEEAGNKFKDTRKRFETACKRVGLTDFHFHELGQTFASWLVMAGVPLTTVSQLLGHKTITIPFNGTPPENVTGPRNPTVLPWGARPQCRVAAPDHSRRVQPSHALFQ